MSLAALQIILATFLGVIFLVSSVGKLRRPAAFLLAVLTYRVAPRPISRLAAVLLPPLELLAAILLLTDVAPRLAGILAALLLAGFTVAMTVNLLRKRRIPCGCFGASRKTIGWPTVLVDILLAAAAVDVAAVQRQWIATGTYSPIGHILGASGNSPAPLLLCAIAIAAVGSLASRPRWVGGAASKHGVHGGGIAKVPKPILDDTMLHGERR